MKVGVIGLGIMGSAMSASLLKDGIMVIGYGGPRSNREKGAALIKLGGRSAASPREVAEKTRFIVTVLPSVASLEHVIHEENGLLASRRGGLIVMECSTFPIEDKIKARDALQEVGMFMLDAPLSGTGAQAAVKDLIVYVSGEEEIYKKCIPAFKGFCRGVHYVGEFGNGSKMKYVANLLVAIHNVAAAEAFALGMKAGLDPEMIYKCVRDGAGGSKMFTVRGPMMVEGEYGDATMKMDIWQKDMKIIGGYARRINCPTPLLAASAQVYTAAMAQGRTKEDTAAVLAVLEEWARIKR
jgi:putative dehydrogenase